MSLWPSQHLSNATMVRYVPQPKEINTPTVPPRLYIPKSKQLAVRLAQTTPGAIERQKGNPMSQVVSKQSLNALATLAFRGLQYADDEPAKPEYNLDGGAGPALFDLILGEKKLESHGGFLNGFEVGTEFGLAVAAAIVTHSFDHAGTCKAIADELKIVARLWPEALEQAA